MTCLCLSNRRSSSVSICRLPAILPSESDSLCRPAPWRPAGRLSQIPTPWTTASGALELLLQHGQTPATAVPSPEDAPDQVSNWQLMTFNQEGAESTCVVLVSFFQTSARVRQWLPAAAAAAASGHSGGSGFILQTRPNRPQLGHLWAKSSSAAANLRPSKTDQLQSPSHHQLTTGHSHLPLYLTNQRQACDTMWHHWWRCFSMKQRTQWIRGNLFFHCVCAFSHHCCIMGNVVSRHILQVNNSNAWWIWTNLQKDTSHCTDTVMRARASNEATPPHLCCNLININVLTLY